MFGIQNKRIKRLLQIKKRRMIRAIMRKRKRNRIRYRIQNLIRKEDNRYNNIYLIPTQKINLSKIIIKRINNDNLLFYTSNPCIIKHPLRRLIANFILQKEKNNH